jgi:O-methyltransferase
MNLVKIASPDFALGKWVNRLRSWHELLALGWSLPKREWKNFSLLCLRLIPGYTMVQPRRLWALRQMILDVEAKAVEGAIVECGVWNGGSAAMMAAMIDRPVWLFDSFEGLPAPTKQDGRRERKYFFSGWNKGAKDRVLEVFAKLNVSMERVHLVPGWFEDTLRTAPVGPIALLHVDADWYESVKTVLAAFYDQVAVGGYIVLDDYGAFQGCRRAFEDFFLERGLEVPALVKVDWTGHYFRKTHKS